MSCRGHPKPLCIIFSDTKGIQWVDTLPTDSKLVADVPVSAPQTQVAQLEATIRSAHALLQAGLIDEATCLLAAFSTEVQPKIDRALTEVRSKVDRTLPNAERW